MVKSRRRKSRSKRRRQEAQYIPLMIAKSINEISDVRNIIKSNYNLDYQLFLAASGQDFSKDGGRK